MPVKVADLFDAFGKNEIPRERGLVVSSFFVPTTAYARYQIVYYGRVTALRASDEGLAFAAAGSRIHVLVEPSGYPDGLMEPIARSTAERIPLRFAELDRFDARDGARVYSSKAASAPESGFTVPRPAGIDFAFCFYALPDLGLTLQLFFEKTLNREAGIHLLDARSASEAIAGKAIAMARTLGLR